MCIIFSLVGFGLKGSTKALQGFMLCLLASDSLASIGQVRCQDASGLPMHLVAFTELILPRSMRKVRLAILAAFPLVRIYGYDHFQEAVYIVHRASTGTIQLINLCPAKNRF